MDLPSLPGKRPQRMSEIFLNDEPKDYEDFHISDMSQAMSLALSRNREVTDDDPDPYGYGQEVEQNYDVDIIAPHWKAKPDDDLWVKRMRSRSRKAAVSKLFIQGHTIQQIAQIVKVSEALVARDIHYISKEWRKSYLDDIEILAGKDLARLDHYLVKLAPGIERGDPKSVSVALEIIKERGSILGYRQGVQVDITQYIREVAEANGYDPERAIEIATRVSYSLRG